MTDDELNAVINFCDADGRGEVTQKDFVALMLKAEAASKRASAPAAAPPTAPASSRRRVGADEGQERAFNATSISVDDQRAHGESARQRAGAPRISPAQLKAAPSQPKFAAAADDAAMDSPFHTPRHAPRPREDSIESEKATAAIDLLPGRSRVAFAGRR